MKTVSDKNIKAQMKRAARKNRNICDNKEKTAHSKKYLKAKKKILKAKRIKQQELLRQKLVNKEDTEDDITIHKLEKLMNIKPGRKNKIPSAFVEDGLDYLLDVVEGSGNVDSGSDNMDVSDDELSNEEQSDIHVDIENKEEVRSFKTKKGKKVSFKLSDHSNDVRTNNDNEVECAAEEEDTQDSSDDTSDSQFYTTDAKDKDNKSPSGNSFSGAASKYVPPACRRFSSSDEEKKLELLKRQMKGLLNRLSDSNMKSICIEIENLFTSYSRAHANRILTDLILEQLYTPDPIPEKLIIELAMVVAVLSLNVGIEVVAYVLEVIVNKLNDLFNKTDYGEGKKSNNLIQLICSLYQLKITQKQLILDLIEFFLQSFTERDVELMVVILKATGFQLRKDDPVSLKSFVERTTAKSALTQEEQSPRMKFMLEILTAIKNNNVRKVLDYDAEGITARRKKVKLISVKDFDGFADVSLADLVNADQKGRWWIVGSSWGGAPMLKPIKEGDDFDSQISEKIKKAAKKLRINTEVRKRIFYSVMSADDFVDAFESIFRLNLKGKQMREVSHVLMKCCEEEKSFNPFYFHLLNKLCHHDREFIMTVQCSFWDRFKFFKTLSKKNSGNLTKLLSNLLLSEALPLSSLKAIEFSEIDKAGVAFLRNVFANMATDARSLKEIERVFDKLDPTKYSSVRNGLRLFIQHFMLKDSTYIKENFKIEDTLSLMDRHLDVRIQSFNIEGLF